MSFDIGTFVKQHKSKIQMFLSYAVPFGFAFGANKSWQTAVVSGVLFALPMTWLHLLYQKSNDEYSTKSSGLLIIYLPQLISYICVVGAIMFSVFGYLAWISQQKTAAYMFIPFVLLCLSSLPTLCSMVVVGRTSLLKRSQFFTSKEEVFYFKDIEDVKVTFFQVVKIVFKNGTTLNLPAHSQSFMHLPPHDNDNAVSPQVEGLHRLRTELLRRKKQPASSPDLNEIQDLKRQPYKGFKMAKAIAAFAVGIAFLVFGGLKLQEKSLLKITQRDPIEVGLNDFRSAFLFHKGERFNSLKDKYEDQCHKKKDFNCRFASYLYELDGDLNKGHSLMKLSCNSMDPRSCYNVYINAASSNKDKEMASSILDEACKKDNYSQLTCCTCYAEAKAERVPASKD